MRYDLIALDLDGTALTPENEIAASTREAVAWAREKGCRVVLSTGRICGEAAAFAHQMGADDLMITAGGAQLSRASDGRCFTRISIPWESAVRAAALMERIGLAAMVYAGEDLFVTPYDDWRFAGKQNEGYLESKRVVPSVAEWIANEKLCVDKLFCRSDEPVVLAETRRQMLKLPGVRVMRSAEDNIEVVSPAADKGTSLGMLCRIYGTTLDRAIAIGDSDNDREMLSMVGMAVAMGNADESIKAIAGYVTAANDRDGVAQAIYRFLSE